MKLKNKISGEIKEFSLFDGNELQGGATLKSLTEEWEDALEEPKEFYVVDLDGEILPSDFEDKTIEKSKELGNYFGTKEEAEKVVEKLKAWKRLKGTITRIDKASFDDVGTATLFIRYKEEDHKKVKEALDLLLEVKNNGK